MRAPEHHDDVPAPVSGLGWGVSARLALAAAVLAVLWLGVAWSLR